MIQGGQGRIEIDISASGSRVTAKTTRAARAGRTAASGQREISSMFTLISIAEVE